MSLAQQEKDFQVQNQMVLVWMGDREIDFKNA